MKKLKYILFMLLGIAVISSCSDSKDNPEYITANAVAPTLKALQSAYTLTLTGADNNFDTFAFTMAEWSKNYKLGTQYTVQASLSNTFSSPVTLGTTVDTTVTVTNSTINSILINAKVNPGIATKMYFRVLANVTGTSGNVSGIDTLSSATVTSTITPYSTEIAYPKIYVIGAFNGWNHSNDLFLWSYGSNTTYCGVIDFGNPPSNGFKIIGVANWDNANLNWGSGSSTITTAEAGSIQLVAGGSSGNISNYSKEFYHFTFDTSTLVLSNDFSFNTLSIVGDAGDYVKGWDGTGSKEVDMKYDTKTQRFYADVILSAGQIKFRADHAWTLNWGASSTDGILASGSGGSNINVTAGNYRIYVDLNNPSKMTYKLSTDDYGKGN